MALLSNAMRTAAITGDSMALQDWLAGRQVGRFVVSRAPAPRPPADPEATLRGLRELQARGVIDDGELAALRGRLGV